MTVLFSQSQTSEWTMVILIKRYSRCRKMPVLKCKTVWDRVFLTATTTNKNPYQRNICFHNHGAKKKKQGD